MKRTTVIATAIAALALGQEGELREILQMFVAEVRLVILRLREPYPTDSNEPRSTVP